MNAPSESPVPCHLGGTQFIMRWAGPPLAERICINTDEDVRAIWKAHVSSLAHFDGSKEHMIVIGLNSRRHFLGWHLVAIGSANDVPLSFREIFRAVFAIDAQRVILVHNHPSGDVRPSKPDEDFTRAAMVRFRALEVEFDDHVIVDSEGSACYSMRAGYSEIWPDAREWPGAPKIVPFAALGDQSATLRKGGLRECKADAAAFLSASPGRYPDFLMKLHFQIPESVWNDFQAYARRNAESDFSSDRNTWADVPILNSLMIGIPAKGARGWDAPMNRRPPNGLSLAGRVKQIRQLAKREPMVAVTEELAGVFWERIQERAAFYGITPGELCVSCLAYHAGLESRRRANRVIRGAFGDA